MIGVVVVDDQPMVRAGIRALCERDGDIAVLGEAGDGVQGIAAVRAHRPDVVLMDIRMPRLDGIEATRTVVAEVPATRVVVVTTYELPEQVLAALRAGASGFVAKDVPATELRDAIRTVHRGESLLSPRATASLIGELVATPTPVALDEARLSVLTAREREVLAWVGRGRSNDAIGEGLSLSSATVKTHVNRSMAKLGAHDRAQLVVLAYETGLVRPGGG